MSNEKLIYKEGFKDGKSAQREASNDTSPDWTQFCDICGESPIVPVTGLCGPCCFGDAETAGGNW